LNCPPRDPLLNTLVNPSYRYCISAVVTSMPSSPVDFFLVKCRLFSSAVSFIFANATRAMAYVVEHSVDVLVSGQVCVKLIWRDQVSEYFYSQCANGLTLVINTTNSLMQPFNSSRRALTNVLSDGLSTVYSAMFYANSSDTFMIALDTTDVSQFNNYSYPSHLFQGPDFPKHITAALSTGLEWCSIFPNACPSFSNPRSSLLFLGLPPNTRCEARRLRSILAISRSHRIRPR